MCGCAEAGLVLHRWCCALHTQWLRRISAVAQGCFGAAVPCEELQVAKGMGRKIYTGEKPSKARLCTS